MDVDRSFFSDGMDNALFGSLWSNLHTSTRNLTISLKTDVWDPSDG